MKGVTDWLAGFGSVLKKYVSAVFFGRRPLVETGVIPFFDMVTMTDSSDTTDPEARAPQQSANRKAPNRTVMIEGFFIDAYEIFKEALSIPIRVQNLLLGRVDRAVE